MNALLILVSDMLKPTMRLKQRYVLFKVLIKDGKERPDLPDHENIHRLIYKSLKSLYGDTGVYPMGYRIMEYNEKTGYGIVRFSRMHLLKGIAALALITTWQDERGEVNQIRLMTIGTSGTIKKLKEKYF